jgi:hypothetical protein
MKRPAAVATGGCWACTPSVTGGAMCSKHQRQVSATALRESQPGYRVPQAAADAHLARAAAGGTR